MTNVYLSLSDGQHKVTQACVHPTQMTDGSMGLGVDGGGRKGIREFKERRRDRDNDTDERTMRMI
jgi:hypothetical protein